MSYPGAQQLADHLNVAKTKNGLRVVDLAAGSGIWGIALAQKSPRVRVTAVDWAGMIPTTKRITGKFGVRNRFELIEGRFVGSKLRRQLRHRYFGDFCIAKVENAVSSCSKVFRALRPGGTIAIAEWREVDDDRTKPLPSLMFAVQMLVNTEKATHSALTKSKMAGGRRLQKSAEIGCARGRHRSSLRQNLNAGAPRISFSSARQSVCIREIKSTKPKSRAEIKTRHAAARSSEQNVPSDRKAALRSEAFARALIDESVSE